VKNRVGPHLDEYSFDGIHISEIPTVQGDVRGAETRDVGRVPPNEPMDLVTFAAEVLRYVTSNKSRDARYQNALAHRFLSYSARYRRSVR
jgi:hypothetical protein